MPQNPNLESLLHLIQNRLDDEESLKLVKPLLNTLGPTDLCGNNTGNNILLSLILATNHSNALNACAIFDCIQDFSNQHHHVQYNVMSILMRQSNPIKQSALYEILIHPVPMLVDTYFQMLDAIAPPRVPPKTYFNLINPYNKLPANWLYQQDPPGLSKDISAFEVALFSTKWADYSKHLHRVLSYPGAWLKSVNYPSIDNILRYGDINTLRRCLEELSFLRQSGALTSSVHNDIIRKSFEYPAAFYDLVAEGDWERITMYRDHIFRHTKENHELHQHIAFYSSQVLPQKTWTNGIQITLFTPQPRKSTRDPEYQSILDSAYQDYDAGKSYF